MPTLDVSGLRLAGLEKVADHYGIYGDDLIIIGRILSLSDHPQVVRVSPTSAGYGGGTNLTDYQVIVKRTTTQADIDNLMEEMGFPEERNKRSSWSDNSLGGKLVYWLPRPETPHLGFSLRFSRV